MSLLLESRANNELPKKTVYCILYPKKIISKNLRVTRDSFLSLWTEDRCFSLIFQTFRLFFADFFASEHFIPK